MSIENRSIALLIDAENISAKYVGIIIDEANKYGKINYRRVYGDWTTDNLNPWKRKMSEYGLTPVQQYAYTTGKNASDFSLIIDAMDILYSGKVSSFCIVSSDSDFTKLVTRLREDNIFVFGMGESKTPISLVNSCDTFSYLDKILIDTTSEKKDDDVKTKKETVKKTNDKPISSIPPLKTIIKELKGIIIDNQEEDGWAYWSIVADLLQKKYPGFHPRNYGPNIKPLTFFKQREEFSVKIENIVAYIKNNQS